MFVLLCIFPLMGKGPLLSISLNFKLSDGKNVDIHCIRMKIESLTQSHRRLWLGGFIHNWGIPQSFLQQKYLLGRIAARVLGLHRHLDKRGVGWLVSPTGNPPAALFTLVVPHRNTYRVSPCEICAKSRSSWQQIRCFLAKWAKAEMALVLGKKILLLS